MLLPIVNQFSHLRKCPVPTVHATSTHARPVCSVLVRPFVRSFKHQGVHSVHPCGWGLRFSLQYRFQRDTVSRALGAMWGLRMTYTHRSSAAHRQCRRIAQLHRHMLAVSGTTCTLNAEALERRAAIHLSQQIRARFFPIHFSSCREFAFFMRFLCTDQPKGHDAHPIRCCGTEFQCRR